MLRPDFVERVKVRKEQALADYDHVWDPYLLHLAHCLAAEFKGTYEGEATYQELQDFIEDLARKDDGHFAKLYDKHATAIAAGTRRREVVLTTMHKVKGLEFDAVLLPPSVADFGLDKHTGKAAANLFELVEEERRLLYVAYTRARYRLVVMRGDRERAVAAGQCFALEGLDQQLGRTIKEGPGKVQLYWWAKEGLFFTAIHNRVLTQLKVGDPLTLAKDRWGYWGLEWRGNTIGRIGFEAAAKLPERARLEGLVVSHISYYTLADSLAYDAKHGTDFTDKWGATARTRGYIYLVDFAGYYQVDTD